MQACVLVYDYIDLPHGSVGRIVATGKSVGDGFSAPIVTVASEYDTSNVNAPESHGKSAPLPGEGVTEDILALSRMYYKFKSSIERAEGLST